MHFDLERVFLLCISFLRARWKLTTFLEDTFKLIRNMLTMIFKYNKTDMRKKSVYENLANTVWAQIKSRRSMTDSINLYNKNILIELLVFRDV